MVALSLFEVKEGGGGPPIVKSEVDINIFLDGYQRGIVLLGRSGVVCL